MASMELRDEEIEKFADPSHWLNYFPPHTITDLKKMGIKVSTKPNYLTLKIQFYYTKLIINVDFINLYLEDTFIIYTENIRFTFLSFLNHVTLTILV